MTKRDLDDFEQWQIEYLKHLDSIIEHLVFRNPKKLKKCTEELGCTCKKCNSGWNV